MSKNFFFLLILFFEGCTLETLEFVLDFSKINQMVLNDEHTSVILVHSFPAKTSCNYQTLSANLYFCAETYSDDPLWVVDICSKVPYFAKTNFKGERDLIIEKINIKKYASKVSIYIHDTIKFNHKSKFIIGKLTKLEY